MTTKDRTTTKTVKQVRGLRHSKPGLLLSIGVSAFGAFRIVKDIRAAHEEGDNLKLANAAVTALTLITGTALVLRELRHLGDNTLPCD